MVTYLELDDGEAASVLYGMHESEWPELAANMMAVPVQSIAHVTAMVENGTWSLVVTEH